MPIRDVLFDKPHYQMLKAALDAAALRNSVIARNIANAETPGYRQQEVRFEELLEQAAGADPLDVEDTGPGHMNLQGGQSAIPRPEIVEAADPPAGSGLEPGAFDLEKAMVELNENKVRYHALVTLISGNLIGLKNAIDGSR